LRFAEETFIPCVKRPRDCLPVPWNGYKRIVGEREPPHVNPSRRVARADRWLRLAPTRAWTSSDPPPPLDDEALVEAVQQRDVRRAGELHDRLIPVVESTLRRLLGPGERELDDLVQATFEQIVVTLTRGRFSGECSLSTWASSVAAHVAFNALRGRRRANRVFDANETVDVAERRLHGDAEREMRLRDQIRVAQVHLSAMKRGTAMVLLLHDVLGHELAEIAAMLQMSISAAQSRLVRGRRDFLQRMRAGDAAQEEGS
jgi:RNA polymerase sigma-70 factor (ECF subfamily)